MWSGLAMTLLLCPRRPGQCLLSPAGIFIYARSGRRLLWGAGPMSRGMPNRRHILRTPFQAPPAHPPHMQQLYENQVPQMPYAEPGQGGQIASERVDYPAGNAMDEPDQFKNKSIGLWEQYGKILMIAILALVIIFLASYLYNQYNANRMFSLNDMPGKTSYKANAGFIQLKKTPRAGNLERLLVLQTENTAPKLNTLGEQRA